MAGQSQAGEHSLSAAAACHCMSLHGRDLPCVCSLNILHFFLGLSGGNLFTDWATMAASLLGPQRDAIVVVWLTSKINGYW